MNVQMQICTFRWEAIEMEEYQIYQKLARLEATKNRLQIKLTAVDSRISDLQKELEKDAPGIYSTTGVYVIRTPLKRRESATPAPQRVLKLIKEISNEEQGLAPVSKVIQRSLSIGMLESETRKILDQIRRDGDVFEPRPGLLKLP